MKSTAYILLILCFTLTLQNCDKIDDPYADITQIISNPNDTDSTIVIRKILIEEHTGQGCGNCPGGAVEIKNLSATYGSQLIVASIHSGFFAIPGQGNPYTSDYTTPAGETYYSTFNLASWPAATVNRNYSLNNKIVLGKDDWDQTIQQLKDITPEAKITLSPVYNVATKQLTLGVDCEFLSALTGSYNLVVYLIEDSIVDDQLNYANSGDPSYPTGHVTNYLHRHVLRTTLSQIWGDTLTTIGATSGQQITQSYTATLNSSWVDSHCSVIAYISGGCQDPPNDCEIIQVEEKHIIE